MKDLPKTFWDKVNKIEDGCWVWTGAVSHGYGNFYLGGKTHRAHRLSYEGLVGPIPEGLTIDHLCRVTRCVNPRHLEPVTLKVNVLRGTSPTANHARQTHCIRGHKLSGDNLRAKELGRRRRCIACSKGRDSEFYQRNRARMVEKAREYRRRKREESA